MLKNFFEPRSVAIIGASRNPKKIGHVIFRNFIEGSFKGKVYPINPNTRELLGQKCYPTVLSVKDRIDLAVICVQSPIVPGIIEQCGKKGIKACIIISGGFREIGNTELENQCIHIAKKYGIRILGPNCMGIFSPVSGVDTLFLPRYKVERPKKGNIAFISQSGALGSVMLDWMAMKGYKLSYFVSYGNAADVDETELLEYLSNTKTTRVICAYIEGVKNGRKFYNVLRKVSRKLPVIILKGGRTQEGTNAIHSHTGSLAGTSEIYTAAFKQANVIEAKTLEDLFDFARILSTQPKPKGNKIQIITNGGGFGILMADAVISKGMKLAEMSKKGLRRLKDAMPPYVVLRNPMDLTGDATTERYRIAIESAISDKNVDMIIVISLLQTPLLTTDIVDVISELGRKGKKPTIFVALGGRFTSLLKKTLEDSGIPTFSYPERAAESLKVLYEYYRKRG